jgi:hypothetical protein
MELGFGTVLVATVGRLPIWTLVTPMAIPSSDCTELLAVG